MSVVFRTCLICDASFAGHHNARYCSADCVREAQRKRSADRRARAGAVEYVCAGCSRTMTRNALLPASKTGLCQSCQARQRSGEDHPRWVGGECFNKALGRWVVSRDGKRVLRYRAVMEAHLGRPLERSEHVHHINGDPTDDRIENLELMSASEHSRLHARTHWAEGTGVACRTS